MVTGEKLPSCIKMTFHGNWFPCLVCCVLKAFPVDCSEHLATVAEYRFIVLVPFSFLESKFCYFCFIYVKERCLDGSKSGSIDSTGMHAHIYIIVYRCLLM